MMTIDAEGSGSSKHTETGDTTVWRDVRLTACTNGSRCSFIGTGLSVLPKNCEGALVSYADMVSEMVSEGIAHTKLQEEARHERFTGPAFTLNRGYIGDAPSKVAEKMKTAQCTAEHNSRCRVYGTHDDTEVTVPFLLYGTINLKTGHVSMSKTHYRYVFNTVQYDGVCCVFCQSEEDGQRYQAHGVELLDNLVDMRLEVESPYAKGSITLKPTQF